MSEVQFPHQYDSIHTKWPLFICFLGSFRLYSRAQLIPLRNSAKIEVLLSTLALHSERCLSRDTLLSFVWPNQDPLLAGQSLNSLLYSFRKQLNEALGGAQPVLHNEGCYSLNFDAGINTDVRSFDVLTRWGHQQWQKTNYADAVSYYHSALRLYTGDLYSGTAGTDVFLVIERERLRVGYLTVLSRLAEYYYFQNENDVALDFAQQILSSDPCREDAHRLMMRCYFRRGERAQAIRQYQLCSQILRMEFDTIPEPATTKLYGQLVASPEAVRLTPGMIDSAWAPPGILVADQALGSTEAVDS